MAEGRSSDVESLKMLRAKMSIFLIDWKYSMHASSRGFSRDVV